MPTSSPPSLEGFWTLEDLAVRFDASGRTIRRWMQDKARPLKGYRPGRRLYFLPADVLEWIRQHEARPSIKTPRRLRAQRKPTGKPESARA